jgi:tripartite-type tricarboxylate transporter receptor subunit TctC
MLPMLHILRAGLLVWAMLQMPAAPAQGYPDKPVSLVVPSTPGSTPDVIGRIAAESLTQQLGRQVVVLNKPGAGTRIGSAAVAAAEPDGYTLLLGSETALTLNPHIVKKMNYQLEQLTPVSSVAAAPELLVVNNAVPANNVQELIALLRAKPGTAAGHGGIGTTTHIALEMFRLMTGIQITQVPYQGGGATQTAIMAGQVPFMFSTTTTILPRVKAGQVRALAVASLKRVGAAPEIPTLAESGLPDFEVAGWFGVLAPTGTPREIIDRLSIEIRAGLARPEVRKRLSDLGAEALGSTPEEFATHMKAQYEKYGKLVKDAGIAAE